MKASRKIRDLRWLAWAGCVLLAACTRPVEPPTPTAVLLPSLDTLAGTPDATIPPLPTPDPAALALGQQVYDTHCAACHGANLEGQAEWQLPNEDGSFRAPPHDADGHTWHHPDSTLIDTICRGGARLAEDGIPGSSAMPAFANVLSDAEIEAVLAYIKSSWPADIQALQWERTVMDDISTGPNDGKARATATALAAAGQWLCSGANRPPS